jgi:hypothetical protein
VALIISLFKQHNADLHRCRDTSKKNTDKTAEIFMDYAKKRIMGNSTESNNLLECRHRRQGKDVKCTGGAVEAAPVEVFAKRSKAVIRPLTVKNITLSGPYHNSQENCSILFNIENPNPTSITSFNAETDPQLLRKRDFGVCQYTFDCSNGDPGGKPQCSDDFGHNLWWRYSINDHGIVTLDGSIARTQNLTIGSVTTTWDVHLRGDRQHCDGKTCFIDCGQEACGKCSNGVCSWGEYSRLVDSLGISVRH